MRTACNLVGGIKGTTDTVVVLGDDLDTAVEAEVLNYPSRTISRTVIDDYQLKILVCLFN